MRKKQKKLSEFRKREERTGYLLALPVLLGFGLFYVIPFGMVLWNSFTLGAGGKVFVGFRNYLDLWGNPLFQLAVKNTGIYMAVGIPLLLLLSLLLASVLFRAMKGSRGARLALVFPMVLPVAAVVVLLEGYLQGRAVSMGLLIALYIWKNIGYHVILLFAGMAMIPREYYESAMLDGAGSGQRFWYLTLPLLVPMLFLTVLVSVLNVFKSFRESLLLGGERPPDEIYMIQHFVNNNFENMNYPRLCASMVTMCLVIFSVIGIIYGSYRKREKKQWGS